MSKLTKAFIQVSGCIILALVVWSAAKIISFPFGINYGEAPLMDQVRRIQTGQTLYKADINEPPYIIANYPPMYILMVAAFNSITKVPIFQSGRLVSLFFSIASGSIIGLFGYQLTKNKILGFFSAALFLGNSYVLLWSSFARVDMMALALSLTGLWIIYRRGNSMRGVILACVFFLAASFTRQTYVLAGPMAGFAWLWFQKRSRAGMFLLLYIIPGVLIFGTINALTHNGFYWNIMIANINQYFLSRAMAMGWQLFVLWPVILISSLAMIIVAIFSHLRNQPSQMQVGHEQNFALFGLAVYTLGAAITALTAGKVGSDVNYFLELIAACSIWSVIALNLIMNQIKVVKIIYLALLVVQLAWVGINGYVLVQNNIGARWNQLAYYEKLYDQVAASAQRGIVLADTNLDLVVKTGQLIYYQPFEYGQLFKAGKWDSANFLKDIKQQKFSLILVEKNPIDKDCCWPSPIIDTIQANYTSVSLPDIWVYTPNR